MNTLAHECIPAGRKPNARESLDSGLLWLWTGVSRVWSLAQRYHSVAKQRRALMRLTDRELKDIGLSRVDALQEASKPFWK